MVEHGEREGGGQTWGTAARLASTVNKEKASDNVCSTFSRRRSQGRDVVDTAQGRDHERDKGTGSSEGLLWRGGSLLFSVS